jgi:hypothetical protein
MNELVLNLLRRASIWRIALAAMVTVVAIGIASHSFIPHSANIETGTEWINTGQPSDPRIVLRDRHRVSDEFWVMWITDSSPQILAPPTANIWQHTTVGFIDQRIVQDLKADRSRNYRLTVVSTGLGPKAIDKYYLTQFAIKAKPDLIVYTVNPSFDFTPWQMLATKSIPGELATFGSFRSWWWTLLLTPPSDLFEGLATRYLPAVTHRAFFADILNRWRNWFDPFALAAVRPPTRPVPEWTQRSMLVARAVQSGAWFMYDQTKPFTVFTQLLAMRLIDQDQRAWGFRLLGDLVSDLRDSRIPAFIYMLPVQTGEIAADPIAGPKFDVVERWFETFARSQSDGQIRILEKSPTRFLPGLKFYDLTHLTAPDPFIQMMSREIENFAHNRQ